MGAVLVAMVLPPSSDGTIILLIMVIITECMYIYIYVIYVGASDSNTDCRVVLITISS